jgi:hypothetical protein
MDERIMTLHPKGKSGVNLNRMKYDTIRGTILDSVDEHEEISFKDLTEDVRRRLEGRFDGSISWYVTTVKLDLEARGLIERVPGISPQRLRLAG